MDEKDFEAPITWVDAARSTNSLMLEDPRASRFPTFSVVATMNQTAGRGRHGRNWVAPAGGSLAMSIMLRPKVSPEKLSLLPLIAGTVVRRVLQEEFGGTEELQDFILKWPNDVQAVSTDGEIKKICGILCELKLEAGVVVCGIGINTAMYESDLPVPTATSLTLLGLDESKERVQEIVKQIQAGIQIAVKNLEDGRLLAADLTHEISTIGKEVSAELPNGDFVRGKAAGLSDIGELIVNTSAGPRAISAADVTHLR